jgi:hypothetical protein
LALRRPHDDALCLASLRISEVSKISEVSTDPVIFVNHVCSSSNNIDIGMLLKIRHLAGDSVGVHQVVRVHAGNIRAACKSRQFVEPRRQTFVELAAHNPDTLIGIWLKSIE